MPQLLWHRASLPRSATATWALWHRTLRETIQRSDVFRQLTSDVFLHRIAQAHVHMWAYLLFLGGYRFSWWGGSKEARQQTTTLEVPDTPMWPNWLPRKHAALFVCLRSGAVQETAISPGRLPLLAGKRVTISSKEARMAVLGENAKGHQA